MQTKYRQPLGKTQDCVVLVDWFVGCAAGYQCKASINSIFGENTAWLLPFLFPESIAKGSSGKSFEH